MAVDEQYWASVSQIAASSSIPLPKPPSSLGTKAESRRASLSASTASRGKRALASTSAAWRAATLEPMRAAACTWGDGVAWVKRCSLGRRELFDGGANRADALEHAALQHAIR